MEILSIPETKTTPKIEFNLISGVLEIKGISIPEYPKDFFDPLLKAIERYSDRVPYTTVIHISLFYFNSGTTRYLLHILRTFKAITQAENSLIVKWHYDQGDEDQLDTAKDLETVVEIPFEFVPVESTRN
ncbi:MAG: DUF1987 domain-containing protein [Bacteroidia bacterium]|nr:DUF1987 domain-containing protein [Bacteroidia bacterium]